MSQTQVGLPALSTEESTVVERFIEHSRDVIPGVEVTLAKRFIRPGSNRVVCLAARTCVPLGDDEVASVSDLALRLSDGTNVVLSVSFFNGTESGAYIPFERCIYDPNRYAMHSDSRLGSVLLATCFIACAGFYSMITGPFNLYAQSKTLVNSIAAFCDGPLFRTGAVSPAIPVPKAATVRIEAPVLKPAAANTKVSAPRTVTRNMGAVSKAKWSTPRTKSSKAVHADRDTMFVPPPPVTVNVPYGAPFQLYDQMPMIPTAANNSKPVSSSGKPPASSIPKAAVGRSLSKPEPAPVAVNGDKGNLVRLPKAKEESLPLTRSPSTAAVVREYAPAEINRVQSQLERIPAINGASTQSAPLPGNDFNSLPMERIVAPAPHLLP
jgi:hypothetical protein